MTCWLTLWMGAQLDLPVFHMDLIHWCENWVERLLAEKIPLVRAVEQREKWVFEGGVSATYARRASRADMLVWLDLPVGLRLWRVTKSLFGGLGQSRPDLPKGCTERLHPETLAFYRFIWCSRHTSRAKIEKILSAPPVGLEVVHLRNRVQVATFQKRLSRM